MNRWVWTAALVCGCSSPIEALEPVEPPPIEPPKQIVIKVELAQTAAAEAFRALLPLTLTMYELNGNEKYAELPSALPIEASNPGTIRAGDVMLYGARTLVVFYKTFPTSYAYTPIGRVADPEGLAEALGRGSCTIRFGL